MKKIDQELSKALDTFASKAASKVEVNLKFNGNQALKQILIASGLRTADWWDRTCWALIGIAGYSAAVVFLKLFLMRGI